MITQQQPRTYLYLVTRNGRRVVSPAGTVRSIEVLPEDVVFVDPAADGERDLRKDLPARRRSCLTLVR